MLFLVQRDGDGPCSLGSHTAPGGDGYLRCPVLGMDGGDTEEWGCPTGLALGCPQLPAILTPPRQGRAMPMGRAASELPCSKALYLNKQCSKADLKINI